MYTTVTPNIVPIIYEITLLFSSACSKPKKQQIAMIANPITPPQKRLLRSITIEANV